jgi:vacuolar-type H+-ATPase subunit H
MSTDYAVALIASVLAFLASVIAIVVSAYNARFARFTSEKWRERKAGAYTRIIEALSDLCYYYQQIRDAAYEARELSAEAKREIERHWEKGHLEVTKAANVGAFMISPEAEQALKEYSERARGSEDWFERLDLDYTSTEQCLKKIVVYAKKDLRVVAGRRGRTDERARPT